MRVNRSGRRLSSVMFYITLALIVTVAVPSTSFAVPRNQYAFATGVTGHIGRVMETRMVPSMWGGMTSVTSPNPGTNPSTPMGPIYATMTYVDQWGTTISYQAYVHHQHFYTPGTGCTNAGEASSTSWYTWVTSTLAP